MTSTNAVLHPSQRKSFTINKDTATWLASKIARGESLTFQSLANRNWVAKIARTRYGINVKVNVVKDQLLDPRYTVEGASAPDRGLYNDKHWMTVYKAAPAPVAVRQWPTERNIW